MTSVHRGVNITRFLSALILLACCGLASCSAGTNSPQTPAKAAALTGSGSVAREDQKKQVFVEIAVFRVNRDFPGLQPGPDDGSTLATRLEDPRITLVSTPHIMAVDGHRASLSMGTDRIPGTKLVVTATITPRNDIDVDLDLLLTEPTGPASTRRLERKMTVTVGDHRPFVGALQAVPADPGERWAFTLDARIIRNQADLRQIWDEKQKERDESLRRAKDG
ncbi:hypothetical protein LVJ94_34185 [Pendulispora rubella]|uniref:Lipoprotein n=1 Tax=Pendulispora rubella TaxID=2741070 RepID=A0ABZ2KTC7_9BACT